MNLAEYETFRMMMIMKARERRMYSQLEERGPSGGRLRETRKAELTDGCSSDVVREQYSLLKVRLGEMTPQRKDLREELDKGMDLDRFDFEGRIADPESLQVRHGLPLQSVVAVGPGGIEGRREDLTQQNAPHCDWFGVPRARRRRSTTTSMASALAARRGKSNAEAKGARG